MLPAKERIKMSTLELSMRRVSKTQSLFGAFARLVSALRVVIEAWSEAQQLAHEARRRFPFTTW
jgi:hypothetical protein